MVVTYGQQHHVGEKPTVILINTVYAYTDRHAGAPSKTKTEDAMSLDTAQNFALGVGSDGCQHHYVTILLYSHQASYYYSYSYSYRLTRQETRFYFPIIIR